MKPEAIPHTEGPALRTHGLRKLYGPVVALDDLDLCVPRGSIFGLLGPNGAGKTTTFGILCGFLHPTGGTAEILSHPCGRLHELRGRVAALPQDAYLVPSLTVESQLRYLARLMGLSPREAAAETNRCLRGVGLSDAARKKGSELSHGMHKRALLAQALLGEPELVLLDEPTAGLDPHAAKAVKDLIRSLAPKTTVVLASHNLSEVQELCTHAALVVKGRVRSHGTMAELTRQSAQVEIELSHVEGLPTDELCEVFGKDAVHVEGLVLRIVYDASQAPHEAICAALSVLLAHGAPVLGVRRGINLEQAVLELTDTQHANH